MHRSRVFDALGWAFRVSSDDEDVVSYVEQLYRGLAGAPNGAKVNDYALEPIDGEDAPRVQLVLAGDIAGSGDDVAHLVPTLVHDVNRRAVDHTPLLASHAGGVSRGGNAVVLPAHMESGKTTLTTGLVRAGFEYLTDEAVAFDWQTLAIIPYAKPLSIDQGAWALFPGLEPDGPFGSDGYKRTQWQVPADAIRPEPFASDAQARYVVFPSYASGVRTELVAITRGEALVELAKNTFRFREHGRRALTALARVAEGAECYRLPVGDLDDAVALIDALVEP